MNLSNDTEQRASGGANTCDESPPKIWRLAISTLLGIGASFVLLGLFDYSTLGFVTVGAFWFMAVTDMYRRFRKKR